MKLTARDPRRKRFKAYLQERFPLASFLPLIVLFTCALSYSGQVISGNPIAFFDVNLLLGFGILLLVFFQLRLFDEFKDYENDLTEHPDRLVSLGVVSLPELRFLTLLVLLLEVLMVIRLSALASLAYLSILVFSLLMFKEFFLGEWLRRDMLIYAISHQAIILFMAWFGLNLQTDVFFSFNLVPLTAIGGIFLMSSFAFELSRKVHDPQSEPGPVQSYTAYLGWRLTGIVVVVLFVLATLAFWKFVAFTSDRVWLIAVQVVLTLVLSMLVLTTGFDPTTAKVKRFQNWTALHMLLLFINLIINSYLVRTGSL